MDFLQGNTNNKCWYNKDKKLHRIDGPALIYENGTCFWYKDGKLHRDDGGPACVHITGTQEWYCDGQHHRVGGPAVVRYNTASETPDYEWYLHGRRHRINGPAVILSNGDKEWWLEGVKQPYENIHEVLEHMKYGAKILCISANRLYLIRNKMRVKVNYEIFGLYIRNFYIQESKISLMNRTLYPSAGLSKKLYKITNCGRKVLKSL